MAIATREFIRLFEKYPLRSQENVPDPLVVAKLFDIAGDATWYLTEFDPESKTAFGYVAGLQSDEWGYFHIPELEAINFCGIRLIERDLYFVQKPIGRIVDHGGRNE